MKLCKLLIVTSKWPGKCNSSDGGNSTVRELIDILKEHLSIDILYFGKNAMSDSRIGVDKIFCCNIDFDHYESYSAVDDSKFSIRLMQSLISAETIERYFKEYDCIVLIHNMFLLGIDPENKELLSKIVLFPMFTGEDYKLCGEMVPRGYLEKEKKLMSKVRAIIVPSQREKMTLEDLYAVNKERIHIIHRCVDRFPFMEHCIMGNSISIVYIASVRKQKAHMDSVYLLKKVIECGIEANLYCIGAIQDKDIYKNCIFAADGMGIGNNLFFTGNLEYEDIKKYLKNAAFNISVSKWETFGRGIFEGFAAGVPTIVLKRILSINEIVAPTVAPLQCNDIDEMAKYIIKLRDNNEEYVSESKKGLELRKILSTENVKDQLIKVLLG